LIGVQVGGDVHVFDRATGGRKPALVEALGATYHTGSLSELGVAPDIVVECTGAAASTRAAAEAAAPGARRHSVPHHQVSAALSCRMPARRPRCSPTWC
jgi:hypothetical protein